MFKRRMNSGCWLRRGLLAIAVVALVSPPVWSNEVFIGSFRLGTGDMIASTPKKDIIVTGKVTSATENMPLPGVAVKIKGSDAGTTTDLNGNYSITVPGSTGVLIFSFIGFNTIEIPTAGRSVVNVQLNESQQLLNEVVVRVPYGTQTRASFTGSAATVQSETVSDRPRASFQESLQGNVAGLQVSQGSGQPGAAVAVRIRGISTITGSGDPLYVVDGTPVVADIAASAYAWSSNTLAGINPNDIEDVTVLKDASATSIYGSRGANGVILITTKRGKEGRSTIDLTVQQGVGQLTMKDRNKPLNTAEMTELLTEGLLNNPAYGITTAEAARTYLQNNGVNQTIDTDWMDLVTQNGNYQQYNLSASGGNDKTTFYLSGGYFSQESVVKSIGYDKLNVRLNLNHKATDKLSFSGSIGGNYQDMNTFPAQWWGENPIRNMRLTSPWMSPYNADGTYNLGVTWNNEILINENYRKTNIYQVLGNLGAEYKILDQLSFETKGGLDFNMGDEDLFWDPRWVDARPSNGVGGTYMTKISNWNITNLLKYRQQFSEFGIEATLGQESQEVKRKRTIAEKGNFTAGLETLDAASQIFAAGGAEDSYSMAAYFLNTSFNYQGKYYLNLTGRRDGSSRFGGNKQYGNFGSVGLAWNVHQEGFMNGISFLDELKLRGSYGVNGNLPGDWYAWRGFYQVGYNYGNSPGFGLAKIENRNLTWEKNLPFNVGVDFSILNKRISATFDYYTRKTTGLLLNVPISFANSGIAAAIDNVGSMKNSGIELAISSQNIQSTSGLNWTTSFNISTSKNEITELPGDRPINDGFFRREEGVDFYQFYMRGWAGVDPQSGEGLWYTDESQTATTSAYNNAGLFNQGSALPDFFGGLTNRFDYRNFGLSFQFYFNWGNKIFDNYGRFTQSDGSLRNSDYANMDRVTYENRWQKSGDATIVPKVVYGGAQTSFEQNSTRFIYDGSYIRLRDITFSYTIPVKKYINRAQLYVRGNNLLTYIKDDVLPYDPEGYLGGLNNGQVPVSKQVVLGLNVSF